MVGLRYADPKKVHGLAYKNKNIKKNVTRYLTYRCKKKKLNVANPEHRPQILALMEDSETAAEFLMDLANSGRKHDVIDLFIGSWKKFHNFLIDAKLLSFSLVFTAMENRLKRLFAPLAIIQLDRRANVRMTRSQKVDAYDPCNISKAIIKGYFDYVMDIFDNCDIESMPFDDLLAIYTVVIS